MSTATLAETDLMEITRRGRSEQHAWSQMPLRTRLRHVRAFRRLLVSAQDALTAAVEQDIGKPPVETVACELLPLAEACRFLERNAIRLLRPGGVLAVDNMLWHDQVADPAARDATTTTLRDLGKWLRDHDDLVTALLPVGDGLLVAVRR